MLQFSPLPLRQGFESNSLISACFVLVYYVAECLEVSLLLPLFQLSVPLHHFATLSCLLVSLFSSLSLVGPFVIFLSSPRSFLSHFFSASCFSHVSLFRFFPPSVGTSFFDSPPPPPTLYSAVICDFGKEHIYWGGISPWQRSRW